MKSVKSIRLGDVAQFIRGINFKPDDVVPVGTDGSVACMRTKNVQELLDCGDVWGISEDFVRRPEQILNRGDILVSSANSWNLVGKCCWIPELPWRATFGGFVSVLRADAAKVEPRFLYWWFSSEKTQALLRSFGQKTTNISNLNMERCLNLQMPLPTIPEQARIAAILDQTDSLRVKRRESLAQLDSLTQSIFIDMFGDPITNPKNFARKKIGDIGRTVTGNTPPRANPENYGKSIEWIKSDNINTPHYYLTQAEEGLSMAGKLIARTVPAGAILVTCIAGSPECIGNAAMADREVAFNQQINAFIPEDGDAHFYYAQILVGKKLIQEASTASMKGMVSKGRFEQILLMTPPVDLQRKFAQKSATVENLKSMHLVSLTELDNLFASLQQRAFRGEL